MTYKKKINLLFTLSYKKLEYTLAYHTTTTVQRPTIYWIGVPHQMVSLIELEVAVLPIAIVNG